MESFALGSHWLVWESADLVSFHYHIRFLPSKCLEKHTAPWGNRKDGQIRLCLTRMTFDLHFFFFF